MSPLALAADTKGITAEEAYRTYRETNYVLWYDHGGCGSGSSSGGNLPGDNNAERAYNYLVGKGYTPEQAAGIVGNMIHESGVNPQRLQGTGLNEQTPADKAVGSSSGWGIVQWTPAGKMIKPMQDAGKDPNTLEGQLDYLTNELETNEKSAGDAVRSTKSVQEATVAFEEKYERAGVPALENRLVYAQAIYDKATKGTPLPPEVEAAIYKGSGGSLSSGTSSPSKSCGGASDNGECKNPFRDLQNSESLRFDGGLDYGGNNGSGPVYAACPAEIVKVFPDSGSSGWPGVPGSYITYKITAGKAKGLFMYISEDCTPKVKEGDKVTTDQPICDYKQASAYLETGWSEGGGNQYVAWSDYPGKDNGYASNSGVDVGKFLETLGVGKGHVDSSGPSTVPPPPDWPKWDGGGTDPKNL